ncbi:MAG: tyrosine-protein phosphatase [Bacteroidales bacterium]|nr:tyrosine-protein phosphatase [Bacteroidales bacterium]
MKTTISRFHSVFFSFFIGTLVLFSCAKEPAYEILDDDFVEMTITVSDETKTINDGVSTLWAEGDALTVLHSATNATVYWPSYFYWYGSYTFTGMVNKLSATNDWYAVYPYNEIHSSAESIDLTFPSSQVQVGNSNMQHFAGENFPMFGKTEGVSRTANLNIRMRNLLTAAEFQLTNTTDGEIIVREVEFTAPSPISGGFKVDITGDDPVLTPASGSTKTVKLTVDEGEAIAAGADAMFNLAVAPFDAPEGSELKIKVVAVHPDDPGTLIKFYHTITLANATSFSPGNIKTILVSFDEDHQTNPDGNSGAAAEVEIPVGGEPEDGVYLLVYENGANSMAFAAYPDYKSQKYAIPVTVDNGTVVPQDGMDLSYFAITIEDTGEEHSNDPGHHAYNVRNAAGQFVFYSTGGGNLDAADALQIKDINEMDIDGTTYKYYHTFVQAEDGIQVLSSIAGASGGNKYLLAYSDANGFYYEQDNNGQKLHLYLLGGSAKEKQELSFSAPGVTYDWDTLGEGTLSDKPALRGAFTTVTWSSNNTSVATVDLSSGNVTIHGPGIAVITASAAANDDYYAGSASYTIEVTSSTVTVWYKADEFVEGRQYLIISNGYALQNNNGSVAATAVNVSNETITMNAPSAILWTASSNNRLVNNSQYLGSSTSSSGGGFPGYGGSASLAIGSQSNAVSWTYNADGNTLSFSSSSYMGSTTNYLYYSSSSSAFTINSSASDTHVAALYSTVKPLEKQNLSFDKANVSKVLGEDCEVGSTFAVQAVKGAHTMVTYSSSNSNVATINGTQIIVKGLGFTIITATAAEDGVYRSATATYTLRINNPAPAGFTSLGVFNLENSEVKKYITAAISQYTDENYHRDSGNLSIIANYTNNGRPKTRLDVPEPVKLYWDDASTGTATVTVYKDMALEDVVWTWTATSGSTSFDVYNLIPGETYYCTVIDNADGDYLLKATFETEGRRRMLMVSDKESADRANNCRDLGGLKTTNGKRIKYGMIYRGTNLTNTSPEEKQILAEFMNIGLDNDLRDNGDPNSATGSSSNRNNPFKGSGYDVVYCGPGYGTGIGSTSGSSLTNPDRAAETMQAFIDCIKRGKAAYFHCYIGSDRTGYWGLLIEGLLGVSPKDCSIDFELTGFAGNITSGDRPRNSTGYTYYQGMDFFKGKDYWNGNLEDAITHYVINELHISASDVQYFKDALLEDDPEM